MRRVMLLVVLAFVVAACRGGSTTPTPNPQNGSPPAGVTIWSFIYKPVSSHTCPGPPAIPNDGGTVTITLAPDGNTLSLVGVAQTTITVPTIAKDGTGTWLHEDPVGIAAGAFLRISFKFLTSRLAQGEVFAFKTILADLTGATCSATWPIQLDRQ